MRIRSCGKVCFCDKLSTLKDLVGAIYCGALPRQRHIVIHYLQTNGWSRQKETIIFAGKIILPAIP